MHLRAELLAATLLLPPRQALRQLALVVLYESLALGLPQKPLEAGLLHDSARITFTLHSGDDQVI